MNMQALLKQAKKMQSDLAKLENELNENIYKTSTGGGAVKVAVKGNMLIESISIDESLLEKSSKEDLEEMLKFALNDALQIASDTKEKSINGLTGGVKMPGGF